VLPEPARGCDSPLRATVVIPVRDGARHLEAVLDALSLQLPAGIHEVLALDSDSRDGSAEILERHGVRRVRVLAGSFDHGETRNLGAREARGDFVVFLSQDAQPADGHLVARLVGVLDADPRLAGAFARQRPRPDADPLTRRDLAGWVACAAEPRSVFIGDAARFDALPPLERYRLCVFDDVASAVRRELLLAHPFERTPFGEDVEWGQRMLRLGYGLAYVPEAVVIHSHPRTARALFRRNYLCHRLLSRLFGLRTIPDAAHLARAAAGALSSDLRTLLREGAEAPAWLAAPGQTLAATYGQYRGARDERLGRPYPAWAGR
jgi:rhamnosyltransferase